ncbi:MAG: hypothetical protein WC728_00440 [Elusimicrobiota bacterium]
MMRLWAPAVMMLLMPSFSFSSEAPVSISSLVGFSAPKGWRSHEEAILGEPVVTLSSGSRRMTLELFGGKDSRHETAKAFLESFEARGDDGKPAASLGRVKVSGRGVRAYARRYSMSGRGRDPDDLARPEILDQQFVLLPVGEKFLAVSWTRSSIPDLAGAPAAKKLEPEFAGFLKSLKIRRSPR